MQTSPDWLRTVEVWLGHFDRDGVDVGMLLGDFQLRSDRTRDRERGLNMSQLIKQELRQTMSRLERVSSTRGSTSQQCSLTGSFGCCWSNGK